MKLCYFSLFVKKTVTFNLNKVLNRNKFEMWEGHPSPPYSFYNEAEKKSSQWKPSIIHDVRVSPFKENKLA